MLVLALCLVYYFYRRLLIVGRYRDRSAALYLSVCPDNNFFGSNDADLRYVFGDLTGRVWFGSHVTWYTESYRNLTSVGFGRSHINYSISGM